MFFFSTKGESPYKNTSFLLLPDKDSKTEFTLSIRSNDGQNNAVNNVMYLQNYKNIRDSCNLENYVEVHAYLNG